MSRKVDLIITDGGTPPALAAKNATSTIPIVFTPVGDPVGFGLVASLARPGGNLTGFSNLTLELTPKRLEMLCELVPQATVIALLVNPDNEMTEKHIRITQEAARGGDPASSPASQGRRRDRHGFRLPRPTTSRRNLSPPQCQAIGLDVELPRDHYRLLPGRRVEASPRGASLARPPSLTYIRGWSRMTQMSRP